jgi:hypothetical protein
MEPMNRIVAWQNRPTGGFADAAVIDEDDAELPKTNLYRIPLKENRRRPRRGFAANQC